MVLLAKSAHYQVYREYEMVLLKIKSTGKIVLIGDFYGDVSKVLLSPSEKYCIMAGCGVIVYQLQEPYIPYEYEKDCDQWVEWDRNGSVWIDDIVLQNDILSIINDTGQKNFVNLESLFKSK